MIPGVELARCRTPEIVADAAHAVLVRAGASFNGQFLIDEDVLRDAGVTDFARYAVDPDAGAAARPVPRRGKIGSDSLFSFSGFEAEEGV